MRRHSYLGKDPVICICVTLGIDEAFWDYSPFGMVFLPCGPGRRGVGFAEIYLCMGQALPAMTGMLLCIFVGSRFS